MTTNRPCEALIAIRELHQAADYDGCWKRLTERAQVTPDTAEFLALTRWRRRLRSTGFGPVERRPDADITLVGDTTPEFLEELLALALDAMGIESLIQRHQHDTVRADRPAQGSASIPRVAIVPATPAALHGLPLPHEDTAAVGRRVAAEVEQRLQLAERLHERLQCAVVLDNLHRLDTRPLGNLGAKTPWDGNAFIARVNLALGERAPSYVHMHDVDALASAYGVRQWFDARYWHHARQPVSFACLVPYVRSLAAVIAALLDRSARCLVLDLDNTLWSGVLDDDGLNGIRVGGGDPLGEAYASFQRYVLRLRERGVALAACGGSNEAEARRAFAEHPAMVLRPADFVAFRSNDRARADNIADIACQLGLHPSRLVFASEDASACAEVRQHVPGARAIALSGHASDFAQQLDEAAPFEAVTIGNGAALSRAGAPGRQWADGARSGAPALLPTTPAG